MFYLFILSVLQLMCNIPWCMQVIVFCFDLFCSVVKYKWRQVRKVICNSCASWSSHMRLIINYWLLLEHICLVCIFLFLECRESGRGQVWGESHTICPKAWRPAPAWIWSSTEYWTSTNDTFHNLIILIIAARNVVPFSGNIELRWFHSIFILTFCYFQL